MQKVTSMSQISSLRENQIIGNFEFINSKVIFNGSNNILISPTAGSNLKTVLSNSSICFRGNNSVVFLEKSKKNYMVNISMNNNNFCSIGTDNYFNGRLTLECSEQGNILIGSGGLFSFNVRILTSDVHLIYDSISQKRINNSKSVFIGDHVWIAQDARIFKGTHIGSGAIVGASTFSAGKQLPSNTIWAGNPARLIKKKIFFLGNSSYAYTEEDTKKWSKYLKDSYIYDFSVTDTVNFLELEKKIIDLPTSQERSDFLLEFSKNLAKNKFYIPSSSFNTNLSRYLRKLLSFFNIVK